MVEPIRKQREIFKVLSIMRREAAKLDFKNFVNHAF